MKPIRTGVLVLALTGSTLVGGLAGLALFSPSAATAQTTTSSPAVASSSGSSAPTTVAKSNEDSAHEAKETAADEKAEDSGQGHCHHDGTGSSPSASPSTTQ